MSIRVKDIKVLWSKSAGRCSYPECDIKLTVGDKKSISAHTLGEMAHIKGEKPESNRHDPSQDNIERNSYKNLILLCAHHHTVIDKLENEEMYSVEVLLDMKYEHEIFVASRLEGDFVNSKEALAKKMLPFINENHEVFINYGPHSEKARKNPHSDETHGIWLLERAGTIVPNNRYLLSIVNANLKLFTPEEQRILSKFKVHVSSYERWVTDDISYNGVVRYPMDFDSLVRGLADAG